MLTMRLRHKTESGTEHSVITAYTLPRTAATLATALISAAVSCAVNWRCEWEGWVTVGRVFQTLLRHVNFGYGDKLLQRY